MSHQVPESGPRTALELLYARLQAFLPEVRVELGGKGRTDYDAAAVPSIFIMPKRERFSIGQPAPEELHPPKTRMCTITVELQGPDVITVELLLADVLAVLEDNLGGDYRAQEAAWADSSAQTATGEVCALDVMIPARVLRRTSTETQVQPTSTTTEVVMQPEGVVPAPAEGVAAALPDTTLPSNWTPWRHV